LVDYAKAYDLQQRLAERRKNGLLAKDLFLVTEHPSVFTLGRRGGRENLVVPEQFLQEKNVQVVQIERGGDITYHGPGQLVIYPIIHLKKSRLSVTEYVGLLEEIMIRLAAECGVKAIRDSRNHGIWVGDKKLGSVGIAIRHGVSFHGLALNVNVDLEPFSWVNPCGLVGVKMTTLTRECGREISIPAVEHDLNRLLTDVFGREFFLIKKDHPDVTMCKDE
jgi:lipoyl(octanoyl) transferase